MRRKANIPNKIPITNPALVPPSLPFAPKFGVGGILALCEHVLWVTVTVIIPSGRGFSVLARWGLVEICFGVVFRRSDPRDGV